jgi:probable DNA metabolism protein
MGAGTWSYDGSLEGLIMLARKALDEAEAPEAVANALAPEGELFALLGPEPLETLSSGGEITSLEAERAASRLRAASCELFDLVLRIWMSEEGLERVLLELCAEVGRRGPDAVGDHGDPRVRALSQAARRVMRETHRLIGFARFSAAIESDHNVLAALVPSFARRFGKESFAVVDVRRRLAVRSLEGRVDSLSGAEAAALLPEAGEDPDARLWRRYYKATENPSRPNPSLRRRLMPVRYWKYLPELASSEHGA